MFDDGALAVSLPAAELAGQSLPGSVFRAADLDIARFTPPLQRALKLVSAAARFAKAELIFVAKPDMFANGAALAWLERRLGSARRHLALSDGATAWPIPGCANGVFFYGLGRRADSEALTRLVLRAPELLAGFDWQINGALRFGDARPAPVVIEGADAPPGAPKFYRLACDAFEPDDGVLRTLGAERRRPDGFEEFVYVPLTETSLRDAHFLRKIVDLLMTGYFERRRGLLLRLPETIGLSSALPDRLRATIVALSGAGARPPIAPAPGVFVASDDCFALASGAATDLVAHASFDFWRASPQSYDAFRSVTLYAGEPEPMDDYAELVEALTGKPARVVRAGDFVARAP